MQPGSLTTLADKINMAGEIIRLSISLNETLDTTKPVGLPIGRTVLINSLVDLIKTIQYAENFFLTDFAKKEIKKGLYESYLSHLTCIYNKFTDNQGFSAQESLTSGLGVEEAEKNMLIALDNHDYIQAYRIVKSTADPELIREFLRNYSHAIFDLEAGRFQRDLDGDLAQGLQTNLFSLCEPFSGRSYVIENSRWVNRDLVTDPQLIVAATSEKNCGTISPIIFAYIISKPYVSMTYSREVLASIFVCMREFNRACIDYLDTKTDLYIGIARQALLQIMEISDREKFNLLIVSEYVGINYDYFKLNIEKIAHATQDPEFIKANIRLEFIEDYQRAIKICQTPEQYGWYFDLRWRRMQTMYLSEVGCSFDIGTLSGLLSTTLVNLFYDCKEGLELAEKVGCSDQESIYRHRIYILKEAAAVKAKNFEPCKANEFLAKMGLTDLILLNSCSDFLQISQTASLKILDDVVHLSSEGHMQSEKRREQIEIMEALRINGIRVPEVYAIHDEGLSTMTMKFPGDSLAQSALSLSLELNDYLAMAEISVKCHRIVANLNWNVDTQKGLQGYLCHYLDRKPDRQSIAYDHPETIIALAEPLVRLIEQYGTKFICNTTDRGPENFVRDEKLTGSTGEIVVIDPWVKESWCFEDEVKILVYGRTPAGVIEQVRKAYFIDFSCVFAERIPNDQYAQCWNDYKIAEAAYRALYAVCRFNDARPFFHEARLNMPYHAALALNELLSSEIFLLEDREKLGGLSQIMEGYLAGVPEYKPFLEIEKCGMATA